MKKRTYGLFRRPRSGRLWKLVSPVTGPKDHMIRFFQTRLINEAFNINFEYRLRPITEVK